jgi:hypothetical protein
MIVIEPRSNADIQRRETHSAGANTERHSDTGQGDIRIKYHARTESMKNIQIIDDTVKANSNKPSLFNNSSKWLLIGRTESPAKDKPSAIT